MRTFKLVGALFAVLAFTAFATATASAAELLWEMLPGTTGTAITGKSGKATLQIKGGGSITCAESTGKEGEITSERTLGLVWILFGPNCTAFGNPVNSLGEEPGFILVHVHYHQCLVEPGVLGWLLKLLPLHLEIPATSLLLSVQGALVGSVTAGKGKTFTLTVKQKAGQQAITHCEGSKGEVKLETSLDGGEFIQSGEEAKESTVTFAAEQEAME